MRQTRPTSGDWAAPAAPIARLATPPPSSAPAVAAESAMVIDVESGQVLYEKNSRTPRAIASTQKLLTALCVLDAGSLDQQVTIQASDSNVEPTRLGFKTGDVYTRRQLLEVLMVKSCNDVARALARDVGGSQEGFAARMNAKARSLGMMNSNFVNPHGLTAPGQISTARDLAILGRRAYGSPVLRRFMSTKAMTFRFSDGRTQVLENTNKVLKKLSFCNGMKTGTTNASGRCLVSSGTLNGRSVVVVVLKSNTPNVWSDSEKLLRWALNSPQGT
jgi:D-alanyl-D-alanine carboxypeptidase (penicillin-binding protein 5/6)